MKLFDELRLLHGMGAAERELIEYGALLHDIGWHIGRDGHHKHSMYLILHGDLKNFTDEEIKVIANIARYHRKATPKGKHDAYACIAGANAADGGCRGGAAAAFGRAGSQPQLGDSGLAMQD